MSKRQLIASELDYLPEKDLDRLLIFIHALKEARADSEAPVLAAQSALAKDWLANEEEAVWANL